MESDNYKKRFARATGRTGVRIGHEAADLVRFMDCMKIIRSPAELTTRGKSPKYCFKEKALRRCDSDNFCTEKRGMPQLHYREIKQAMMKAENVSVKFRISARNPGKVEMAFAGG